MQYRCDKTGTKLSILGYGCLRFPKTGGRIDLDAVTEQIGEAVRRGVNYFDTAYIYGGSEAALGEALRRLGCRDKVYIADKLPQYLIKSKAGMERCFQEQLSRLGTDHIDFYLMHMLTDLAAWKKLCDLGIREWIEEKKTAGAIGRIGFSFHGDTAAFLELLNAYDWDFCQIQYNYLDENTQAGRRGLETAAARGIPVIIMEPLRGGRLITGLSADAQKRVAASGRSAAGWGLRWLWDQPGVTVVLSGMNSLEMVRDNTAQADTAQPGCMTKEEHAFVDGLRADLQASMRVGCTGCAYCQPCPAGVDIPGVFACYNRAATEGSHAKKQYLLTTGLRRKGTGASQCVGCGKCEQHCPQHLPIRRLLKDAAKELEGPLYKTVRLGVRILKLW
ncbi:MAG: aldo/keto reductase [Gemmiger sp.]|uniref:aldo/keto reductase n=1 Tax=Gemmiger sp. TaxID=2049027 RepID=UPI002E78614D|nr:aldo/keto reductase [Gemmiger sp.]MEE0802007.1 aldo/keto reductase [Gemmiger sp.]